MARPKPGAWDFTQASYTWGQIPSALASKGAIGQGARSEAEHWTQTGTPMQCGGHEQGPQLLFHSSGLPHFQCETTKSRRRESHAWGHLCQGVLPQDRELASCTLSRRDTEGIHNISSRLQRPPVEASRKEPFITDQLFLSKKPPKKQVPAASSLVEAGGRVGAVPGGVGSHPHTLSLPSLFRVGAPPTAPHRGDSSIATVPPAANLTSLPLR